MPTRTLALLALVPALLWAAGASAQTPVPIEPGLVEVLTDDPRVAPLKVVTPNSPYDYFIEMLDSDGDIVLTFYVRGGQAFEVLMPLGTYRLTYASGATWYGTEEFFGPDTEFGAADKDLEFEEDDEGYKGHVIELIPQEGGNLSTRRLSREEFKGKR